MADSVRAFAEEAERFYSWVSSSPQGEEALADGLRRVVALYAAALSLPKPFAPDLPDEDSPAQVNESERIAVHRWASGLLLGCYSEIFNPLQVPPEEPVVGHLGDDLGDIYGDVLEGLRLFQSGKREEAIWEWGFGFQHHWGEHATCAIRALHAYLMENCPDRLSPVT